MTGLSLTPPELRLLGLRKHEKTTINFTMRLIEKIDNYTTNYVVSCEGKSFGSVGEVKKKTTMPQLPKIFLNLKPGLTRIWIVLSVLYLIFATVDLIDNRACTEYPAFQYSCSSIYIWYGYANIGTMVGTMLGGLALLWLLPYILVFWIGRGLYWLLCWIKDGFTKVE